MTTAVNRPPSDRPPAGRGRKARHLWRRLYRRVVMIEDSPERVARGFAIGMLIGWLPIVGIQMIVSALICWILRANVFASIPPVWLSNPVTMVPMYWLINQVGAIFIGEAIGLERMRELWNTVLGMSILDGTLYLVNEALQAFLAMLVGGFLIGAILALPSYLLVRRAVVAYQALRQKRRLRWLPGAE